MLPQPVCSHERFHADITGVPSENRTGCPIFLALSLQVRQKMIGQDYETPFTYMLNEDFEGGCVLKYIYKSVSIYKSEDLVGGEHIRGWWDLRTYRRTNKRTEWEPSGDVSYRDAPYMTKLLSYARHLCIRFDNFVELYPIAREKSFFNFNLISLAYCSLQQGNWFKLGNNKKSWQW